MINSFSSIEGPTVCQCGQDHVRFDDQQLEVAHRVMRELQPRVATMETVMRLRHDLADIALGLVDRPVVITGPCHEPVGSPELASIASIRRSQLMARSAISEALFIQRDRGQNTKPRSNPLEVSQEGHTLAAFHGDAVNDQNWELRGPNATRLLRAAAQASFVEMNLTRAIGHHVPAAHEFLNLSFEKPSLRDGFTSSADLPWVGVRNINPRGEHFRILRDVENPVGFKIGHGISNEQLEEVAKQINPDSLPGKIVWMLRLGLPNMHEASRIVSTINEKSPDSITLFDIHGSTRTDEHGRKIRCVDEIIEEIGQLATICTENGTKLNGVHLETTVDESRLECIDHIGEQPIHKGNIDPQLNPDQTMRVLDFVGEVL